MGVHFPTAAGLARGAQVFLNGVQVGSVRRVRILPDTSVDVILHIAKRTDVPKNAIFSVQTTVAGSPTVSIAVPPGRVRAAEVLAKRVLPVSEQPIGTVPLTLEDVMRQGRALGDRVQTVFARAKPYGPRLVADIESARENANATATVMQQSLPVQMQTVHRIIAKAQSQIRQAAAAVRERDESKITLVSTTLKQSVNELKDAADALRRLNNDPRVRSNVKAAQAQLRDATRNLALLAHDMQMLTKNAQTKAELRDASTRLHEILHKI